MSPDQHKMILERLATGREFTSTELSERAGSTVPETQAYLSRLKRQGLIGCQPLPDGKLSWSLSEQMRSAP